MVKQIRPSTVSCLLVTYLMDFLLSMCLLATYISGDFHHGLNYNVILAFDTNANKRSIYLSITYYLIIIIQFIAIRDYINRICASCKIRNKKSHPVSGSVNTGLRKPGSLQSFYIGSRKPVSKEIGSSVWFNFPHLHFSRSYLFLSSTVVLLWVNNIPYPGSEDTHTPSVMATVSFHMNMMRQTKLAKT